MKKKALVASILTIALCLSLIAGSTFALFTSESTVNVAVTSGKVNVVATVDGDISYTSTLGEKLDQSSATLSGNTVTIVGMVPGDVVSFNLKITNNSNVKVNYRTKFTQTNADENKLLDALEITVENAATTGDDAAVAALAEVEGTAVTPAGTLDPNSDPITLKVTIKMPATVSDPKYQGASCNLAYTVEAVQGNAEFAVQATDAGSMGGAIEEGKEVTLANDITTNSNLLFNNWKGKSSIANLNGKNISSNSSAPNGFMFSAQNDNSQITINGTGTVSATFGLIQSSNNAKIIINGGDYIKTIFNGQGSAVVYVRDGGIVEINGGSFKCANKPSNTLKVDTSGGTIIVRGGSFYKFNPSAYVASGYTVEHVGDWYNVVPE